MTVLAALARSRTLWTGLALFGLYGLAASLLANAPLMEGLHTIRIAVGVAVTVAYGAICLDALLMPTPDRVHQLTLGIAIAWTATVLGGCWSLLWRMSGQPPWMLNSDINGFWIWLQILGGILHVTAPGAIDGRVPKRNWILLGCAVGAGAGIGAAMVALQPDLQGFAGALEPYLRER